MPHMCLFVFNAASQPDHLLHHPLYHPNRSTLPATHTFSHFPLLSACAAWQLGSNRRASMKRTSAAGWRREWMMVGAMSERVETITDCNSWREERGGGPAAIHLGKQNRLFLSRLCQNLRKSRLTMLFRRAIEKVGRAGTPKAGGREFRWLSELDWEGWGI